MDINNININKYTIALCGNPNSGKTTLFNLLTGDNQKVGNWPGVTVEKKEGLFREAMIVDTPGIYSILPFSPDEQVTFDFLKSGKADLVVNIVDSCNLERSLYLTSQLVELCPTVVALNMIDDANSRGIRIDKSALEKHFGCKFFEISAAKKTGVDELMNYCLAKCASAHASARPHKNFDGKKMFVASEEQAAATQARYDDISKIAKAAIRKEKPPQSATEKIDKIVLNKWAAFPIFFAAIVLMFFLSVKAGGILTEIISRQITPLLQNFTENLLRNAPNLLTSLVSDGIVAGVMSVVGFLPQVMLLFGFIAALETCGYMARIAFITDKFLRKIGLGGRSFVSMVLGFGCSVPAIMSARVIKNPKERFVTVTLAPFMPCSAKLALISYFCAAFSLGALWAVSFYFVSIFATIVGGLILKKIKRGAFDDIFVLELPAYRVPTAKNIAKEMWQKGKSFLTKAGTIIFCASVVTWILRTFDWHFGVTSANQSILATLGNVLAPIFSPLGFDDGGFGAEFSVAALSGIVAKETVFETLQQLLPNGAENCISTLGAYCFVVFNILTVPCFAAVSASFTESGAKNAVLSIVFQAIFSYVFTLALYKTGKFYQRYPVATTSALCVATITTALFFAVKTTRQCVKRRCGTCANCGISRECAIEREKNGGRI